MTTKTTTRDWKAALRDVPGCCQLSEHLDPRNGDPLQAGDWEHLIDIVTHPIQLTLVEGEDAYTRREAKACVRWLKKHAPEHEMASL
jgi:hypothetical protein